MSVNQVNTIVIKVGSSVITAKGTGIDLGILDKLAYQISHLKQQGIRVVLVSSGAIAAGLRSLGYQSRPISLSKLQAVAAVGQMRLIKAYETAFNQFNIVTAQILLTHDDVKSRTRYLNIKNTIRTLLDLGIVPIINENDSVSFREIKLGDNDTLAALVVNLIDAEGLIILTDCEGLYDANPRENPHAKIINNVSASDPRLEKIAKDTSSLIGTGGMRTKVTAAKIAAKSGAFTVIASGFTPDIILKIMSDHNHKVGTYLTPDCDKLNAKKQWLLSNLIIAGYVYVDEGAKEALTHKNSSLLPIGCTKIEGSFKRGELICIKDKEGFPIARGLSNYSSEDAIKILGKASSQIINILGFKLEEELIHRDNMLI